MPNFRNIRASFLGIDNQPLKKAPIHVNHLSGNYVENTEFPSESKVFYTNNEGIAVFQLWCNEEGEKASKYQFNFQEVRYFILLFL